MFFQVLSCDFEITVVCNHSMKVGIDNFSQFDPLENCIFSSNSIFTDGVLGICIGWNPSKRWKMSSLLRTHRASVPAHSVQNLCNVQILSLHPDPFSMYGSFPYIIRLNLAFEIVRQNITTLYCKRSNFHTASSHTVRVLNTFTIQNYLTIGWIVKHKMNWNLIVSHFTVPLNTPLILQ